MVLVKILLDTSQHFLQLAEVVNLKVLLPMVDEVHAEVHVVYAMSNHHALQCHRLFSYNHTHGMKYAYFITEGEMCQK